jgi:[protein-PII] uridylyltransferase
MTRQGRHAAGSHSGQPGHCENASNAWNFRWPIAKPCFSSFNIIRTWPPTLRRDIFDPRTVAQFAESIGSPERLKMLCLFTYADIKAVNPEALTPWKAEDLWQLYIGTANYFNRSVDERVHARRERRSPESSSLAGRGGGEETARHSSTVCRGDIFARIRWTKFCGTFEMANRFGQDPCNWR